MPFDRRKYPADWEAFSRYVRFELAGGRCQCTGECGLHRTHPGPRRCTERHGEKATWARGKIVLTVAHLNHAGGVCQCEPRCAILTHVKAMCQRCHVRLDHPRHVANARRTRRAPPGAQGVVRMSPCDRPPAGWSCSRGRGHDGPCVATPTIDGLIQWIGATMSPFDSVTIEDVTVVRDTGKALLCRIDDKEVWIPQSQIRDDSEVYATDTSGKLVIPEWLALDKGLI